MLSPGAARPAEGRASRIPGSLAWRQRSLRGKPSPSRPQRAGEVARRSGPGRRWESRIASSAPKATPRYRPRSASLLRRSSPPLRAVLGPRNSQRNPGTDGAERGFRDGGQEGAATLTCNCSDSQVPCRRHAPGTPGSYRPGGLELKKKKKNPKQPTKQKTPTFQRVSATTYGRPKTWGATRLNVPAQGLGDPGGDTARPTLRCSVPGWRHYRCQRLLPATSVFVQCKI